MRRRNLGSEILAPVFTHGKHQKSINLKYTQQRVAIPEVEGRAVMVFPLQSTHSSTPSPHSTQPNSLYTSLRGKKNIYIEIFPSSLPPPLKRHHNHHHFFNNRPPQHVPPPKSFCKSFTCPRCSAKAADSKCYGYSYLRRQP